MVRNWEMFYTDSKTGDDELVDHISIDAVNRRYILDIDVSYLITDGYDENDNPIESTYVSRFVFDMIVDGVRSRKFKVAKWEE